MMATLVKRITSLERAISRTDPTLDARLDTLEPTAWVVATLQNSWADFFGEPQAAYRKIVNDNVQLRGLVQGGTNNAAIFTLPVGFRPAYNTIIVVAANQPTGTFKEARLEISTAGVVKVSAETVFNAWISLHNIVFSTTA